MIDFVQVVPYSQIELPRTQPKTAYVLLSEEGYPYYCQYTYTLGETCYGFPDLLAPNHGFNYGERHILFESSKEYLKACLNQKLGERPFKLSDEHRDHNKHIKTKVEYIGLGKVGKNNFTRQIDTIYVHVDEETQHAIECSFIDPNDPTHYGYSHVFIPRLMPEHMLPTKQLIENNKSRLIDLVNALLLKSKSPKESVVLGLSQHTLSNPALIGDDDAVRKAQIVIDQAERRYERFFDAVYCQSRLTTEVKLNNIKIVPIEDINVNRLQTITEDTIYLYTSLSAETASAGSEALIIYVDKFAQFSKNDVRPQTLQCISLPENCNTDNDIKQFVLDNRKKSLDQILETGMKDPYIRAIMPINMHKYLLHPKCYKGWFEFWMNMLAKLDSLAKTTFFSSMFLSDWTSCETITENNECINQSLSLSSDSSRQNNGLVDERFVAPTQNTSDHIEFTTRFTLYNWLTATTTPEFLAMLALVAGLALITAGVATAALTGGVGTPAASLLAVGGVAAIMGGIGLYRNRGGNGGASSPEFGNNTAFPASQKYVAK